MKNTNIIIVIIVIAAAAIGGYFLLSGSNNRQAEPVEGLSPTITESFESSVTTANPNAVIYSNGGFLPSVLTVKTGETVVFQNQSSRLMWPASAFHPTHQAYPTTGGCQGSTLDACRGVLPGDSWSFEFDIAGDWKYHNHLSPGDTGAIIVK